MRRGSGSVEAGWRGKEALFVGAIVVAFLSFGIFGAIRVSLDGDEVITWLVVRHPIWLVFKTDVRPPLSYWWFKPLSIWFDRPEALRALTILSGAGVVVLTHLLARKLLPPSWALLATALVALSPVLIVSSRHAHPYAVGALFDLLAFFGLVSFLEGRRRLWLYGFFSSLGQLTHPLTVFPFVGRLVALFRKRCSVRRVLTASEMALLPFLLWLLVRRPSAKPFEEPALRTAIGALALYITEPAFPLFSGFGGEGPIGAVMPFVFLALGVVAYGIGKGAWKFSPLRLCAGGWGFTVAFLVLLCGVGAIVPLPSYALFVCPYWSILVVVGTRGLWEGGRRLISSLTLAWLVGANMLGASLCLSRTADHDLLDWREVAGRVVDMLPEGGVVVGLPPTVGVLLRAYLPRSAVVLPREEVYITRLGHFVASTGERFSEAHRRRMEREARGYRAVVLVRAEPKSNKVLKGEPLLPPWLEGYEVVNTSEVAGRTTLIRIVLCRRPGGVRR